MLGRPAGVAATPALPISALLGAASALAVGSSLWLANPQAVTVAPALPLPVALTHAFTLGFVSLAFAGTLQQLPPVLLNTDLAWPRSGLFTVPLLAFGVAALVTGFSAGFAPTLLIAGGAGVVVAWTVLLAQLLLTWRGARLRNEGGAALVTAICYLWLTVVVGLLLASARSRPEVVGVVGYPRDLHLQLGMFGAFLLGVAGAGQKLLAMFALSKGGSAWRLRALTATVHLLVAAEIARAFLRLDLWPLAPALLVAAGTLQGLEVVAILRRRLRRRLEAPVGRYVLAHAFLPVAGVLLLLGAPVPAAIAFLLGFVGLVLSGMAVKIVAFLSWTAAFAGAAAGAAPAARRPAPLLKDMPKAALEPLITLGLALGATLAVAAALTGNLKLAQLGAACYTVGALSLVAQLAHVVLVARGAIPASTAAQLAAESR